MFNKRLILLMLVLLLMTHISYVSAAENNQTDIKTDNYEISINNSIGKDYVHELNDEDCSNCDSIDFNQGDKIPITINSPVDGFLTILIDNEEYDSMSFLKTDTIFISTYNPDSFYNNSIRNMDVGTHNLSLIFNLFDHGNYVPFVSKQDSNLKFQFCMTDKYVLNNTYTYTSTLNIHEIEKTIHLSINNEPTYYLTGVDFIVQLDNIDWNDMVNNGKYLGYFGIIFSDKSNIIYKEDVKIKDAFEIKKKVIDGVQKVYLSFSFPISGITYDVVHKLGICNFTVVNFADGTQDSVLFNVSKFHTQYPDKIECVVNEFSVTYYFYHYFTKIFVSVDDIHKYISAPDDCDYEWNVTFVNLKPGTHVMNLYHPETDFIKGFSYNITFEIKGSNHDILSNTINIIYNNTSFNIFPNMVLIGNNGFLLFNSGYGLIDFQDMVMVDDSSSSDTEPSFDGYSKITGEPMSVGDNVGSSSSDSSSNGKSYEISKKSVSKSTDNLLTKLGLTIISCMSFMVGYVRFEKN